MFQQYLLGKNKDINNNFNKNFNCNALHLEIEQVFGRGYKHIFITVSDLSDDFF